MLCARLESAIQVIKNGCELRRREGSVYLHHLLAERLVQRLDGPHGCPDHVDHDDSSVLFDALAPDESGALETVDHRGHCARRQPNPGRKRAGGDRAGHAEQVETLQIGGMESNATRHRVAQKHKLRVDAAQGFIDFSRDAGTPSAGFTTIGHLDESIT